MHLIKSNTAHILTISNTHYYKIDTPAFYLNIAPEHVQHQWWKNSVNFSHRQFLTEIKSNSHFLLKVLRLISLFTTLLERNCCIRMLLDFVQKPYYNHQCVIYYRCRKTNMTNRRFDYILRSCYTTLSCLLDFACLCNLITILISSSCFEQILPANLIHIYDVA